MNASGQTICMSVPRTRELRWKAGIRQKVQGEAGGRPAGRIAESRVVVAEDHPLMRMALVAVLEALSGVKVVGQAETVVEMEYLFKTVEMDVVVSGVNMMNHCVLKRLGNYLRLCPTVRVLVVSAHEPDLYARFSRKIGANGFVCKQAMPGEFRDAFLKVARGGEAWPTKVANGVLSPGENLSGREEKMSKLTLREMEVFRLIGKWKNTEEIAGELGISSSTVEIHRVHIRKKLGYASASDLLHFAVERVETEWG